MNNNFEWFTIYWLMQNLHWFILLLVVCIILLFFFPVLLGYDLKQITLLTMNNLYLILFFLIAFFMLCIGEIFKLKKEVRKLNKIVKYLLKKEDK